MVTVSVSGADGQYVVTVRLCPVLSDSTWWQYVCVRCCRTVHGDSTSVSGAVGQYMVTVRVSGAVGHYMVTVRLCPVLSDSTW